MLLVENEKFIFEALEHLAHLCQLLGVEARIGLDLLLQVQDPLRQ